MNKDHIIERLEMLVDLIEETSEPTNDRLFPLHQTDTLENIVYLKDSTLGRFSSKDEERKYIISIMKHSNRMWNVRNKIKNGDLDNVNLLELEDGVRERLADGSKINAIKFYREWMNDNMNTRVSLRESKDKVDSYAESINNQLI
jgi:hypothetical protein